MIKFKSIKNDQIGYAWGWDSDLLNRGNVSWDAHQFVTFGDGMVQHSPLWLVEPGNTIDFLYSMAEHLLQNPKEIEEAKSGWGYDEATSTISFLASIHWKEGKIRYYSFNELKISSSDSKKYDKRWTEVPQWADGTLASVYRLFLDNQRMDFFRQIHLLSQIKDWFYDRDNSSWSIRGDEHFSWLLDLAPGKDKWECWNEIVHAYKTVDCQVRAFYLTRGLQRQIDTYKEKS